MSRHHRAHKRGWSRIRQTAIVKAGRRCTRCGFAGKLEVHHARPLSRGGTHDQALVVLCRDCHIQEHHKPDPARAAWVKFLQEFASC